MLMMLQYPFSTGSIHLPPTNTTTTPANNTKRKATATDKPLINPRYFLGPGGENDLEMMSAAQKFADKIVRTAPLSNIIVKRAWPPERPSPSPQEEVEEEEEENFTSWIRANTTTDWHPIGTCSM
ncbi:MAG: hypothetical protein Q9212_007336, partial [Teloschistes hypoglaucus]